MDTRSLLSCFSVAIFAIAIWGHLPPALVRRVLPGRILLGIVMGLGAVGSMLVPVQVQPGLIFDLRAPLLETAGFIGGPLAASVAAALALAVRLHLGGSGMWVGCAGIVTAVTLGAAAHAAAKRRPATPYDLPALAAAVSACSFALISLVLPAWPDRLQISVPLTLLTFACTWLFPLSLMRDQRLHALSSENGIYRAIIEMLPDNLNAKDAQSRFLAANPATARLMRVASPIDLIGRSDADFYPAEVARLFRNEELAVLGGETLGPVDQEVCFPDGSRRWLTTLKTPLRDERGAIRGIITHNRDVTERKRLEVELSRTQDYLHEALANMADGLVLYDAEGVIRFCNQQYRDLFPKTADLRVVGGRFSDIIRAAVERGEECPADEIEAWIGQRVEGLRRAGDRLIQLEDGRIIEARSRPLARSDTLVVFNDVTSRKHLEADLLRRATHDPLTGLANRAEFDFQLDALKARAVASKEPIGLMMLDLDRFKQVNDTYGHAAGDELLIEVARRLRSAIRAGDMVARLGGDEFAFLLSGSDVETGAESLAERVLASLRRPFVSDGVEFQPGGSLGTAVFPRDTADPAMLPAIADQALYRAKKRGGGTWASAEDGPGSAPAQGKDRHAAAPPRRPRSRRLAAPLAG